MGIQRWVSRYARTSRNTTLNMVFFSYLRIFDFRILVLWQRSGDIKSPLRSNFRDLFVLWHSTGDIKSPLRAIFWSILLQHILFYKQKMILHTDGQNAS